MRTYSQCMPRAHILTTFEPTRVDKLVGVAHAFETVGQQEEHNGSEEPNEGTRREEHNGSEEPNEGT